VVNRRAASALIVFVVALAVYLFTMAPTVALIDSGELTDAAWSLGNAHPPGFPLFVLVTHFFTMLPIRSVAWRANFASAFFSAAAAAFATLAAFEFKKERDATVIAIATGLLFAFSRTVWRYAVETEVYALNTALMAAIAWLMLVWTRTRRATPLYAAALLFGLALGVHHVTIGLGALAIAVLITRTAGAAFWRSREAIVAGVLLCAGLLIYAYIPLAAAHSPAMNWGNPRTAHQIFDHVTGKEYRAYFTSAGSSMSSQFDRFFGILVREFGPPWMPLALAIAAIGIVALWKNQRTLFWYIALLIAADVAWVLFYPVKADQDAYVIPSFLALILAFAYGTERIVAWKPRAAYALLIVPLIAVAAAYPIRNRRQFWVARDYTTNAFRAMRPNGLLITGDWQMYSPMRYMLDVEHARADVAIIQTGFLHRIWYQQELSLRYPQMMRSSASEQVTLLNHLWRLDQEKLWNDATALQDLNDDLDALMESIIEHHLQNGPVYMTIDSAFGWNARDKKMIDRLKAKYDILLRGILVEIVHKGSPRDLQWTPIETRGLIDGSMEYDDDDPVPNELVPAYRMAFLTRARYLAITRHFKEALVDYQQAQAFDPENSVIERELNTVQAMSH